MMNDIKLTDGDRNRLLDEHPLVTHDYTVITSQIKDAFNIIRERVWSRRTGTYMYAPPRTGKTYCATAIHKLLQAEFPKVYIVMLLAMEYKGFTINSFIEDMVDAAHLPPVSASKKKNINHLILQILSETANRQGNQFVLLIDEMQLLRDMEFNALLAIHNRLEREKVKMTTIGFAQPSIVYRANMFLEAGESNLIARFLRDPIEFVGCSSTTDLHTILLAYDERLYYPSDSGWSFTRFAVPMAFASGFRLADYTDAVWGSLHSIGGIAPDAQIPMEHVTISIENILLQCLGNDSESFVITDEIINDAVSASGLKSFTKSMNPT